MHVGGGGRAGVVGEAAGADVAAIKGAGDFIAGPETQVSAFWKSSQTSPLGPSKNARRTGTGPAPLVVAMTTSLGSTVILQPAERTRSVTAVTSVARMARWNSTPPGAGVSTWFSKISR